MRQQLFIDCKTFYIEKKTTFVYSLQLGYVLIPRTPPLITRLEARKQGVAYIKDQLVPEQHQADRSFGDSIEEVMKNNLVKAQQPKLIDLDIIYK